MGQERHSRLMAEDEDATIHLVTAYREEVELLVHLLHSLSANPDENL